MVEIEHHPFKMFGLKNGVLMPLFEKEMLDQPRQVLPKVYRQNGAIYLIGSESFLKEVSFFVSPIMPFAMSPTVSIDINTLEDLRMVEAALDVE